jgi:hypothetical protein
MGRIVLDGRQEGSICCMDARVSVFASLITAVGERGIECMVQFSDDPQRRLSGDFRGKGLDLRNQTGMS